MVSRPRKGEVSVDSLARVFDIQWDEHKSGPFTYKRFMEQVPKLLLSEGIRHQPQDWLESVHLNLVDGLTTDFVVYFVVTTLHNLSQRIDTNDTLHSPLAYLQSQKDIIPHGTQWVVWTDEVKWLAGVYWPLTLVDAFWEIFKKMSIIPNDVWKEILAQTPKEILAQFEVLASGFQQPSEYDPIRIFLNFIFSSIKIGKVVHVSDSDQFVHTRFTQYRRSISNEDPNQEETLTGEANGKGERKSTGMRRHLQGAASDVSKKVVKKHAPQTLNRVANHALTFNDTGGDCPRGESGVEMTPRLIFDLLKTIFACRKWTIFDLFNMDDRSKTDAMLTILRSLFGDVTMSGVDHLTDAQLLSYCVQAWFEHTKMMEGPR